MKSLSMCTLLLFLVVPVCTSHAALADTSSSTVFGLDLSQANRTQMRAAAKAHGAVATREDNRYWCDNYDANQVLKGASQLQICYVDKTGALARLAYTFPNFMDGSAVQNVAQMVAAKYGKPAASDGNLGLGPVSYRWSFTGKVTLTVARGWPDTTVHMAYVVDPQEAAMQAEIQHNGAAKSRQTAQSQSSNF